MAFTAQSLPVLRIPEELVVSSMRTDMIDDSRCHQSTPSSTFTAERMILQEENTSLLPAIAVASSCGMASAPVSSSALVLLVARAESA
jgi:hypothetical protein